MIKKFITTSMLSILLLFISTNVEAAQFQDNQVVAANKTWTIHFNKEVSLDDLSKQGIKITDSKGNNTNLTLSLGQDNKTIIVTAPKSGYIATEKYKLTLSDKIHTKNNKNIKQSVIMNFSVKDATVTFKDKGLEQAVRDTIHKPTSDLHKVDVQNITSLGDSTMKKHIKDISGIENLTNLTELSLDNSPISNITALKYLTNLKELSLNNNPIKDITALKELTNLTKLSLNDNTIKDITALGNLTNLKELHLRNNLICDISALKDLTNLTELYLSDNLIDDISSLENLTNLKRLGLDINSISHINALKNLTNLTELRLDNNEVSDINSLTKLVNLQGLTLHSNEITDIQALKGLNNLFKLSVYDNKISNSDIQVLKNFLPPGCDTELIY